MNNLTYRLSLKWIHPHIKKTIKEYISRECRNTMYGFRWDFSYPFFSFFFIVIFYFSWHFDHFVQRHVQYASTYLLSHFIIFFLFFVACFEFNKIYRHSLNTLGTMHVMWMRIFFYNSSSFTSKYFLNCQQKSINKRRKQWI